MDLHRLNDWIAEMHLKFSLLELSATCKCLCQLHISRWTLIRLFLEEQSDLGPNCLLQRRLTDSQTLETRFRLLLGE